VVVGTYPYKPIKSPCQILWVIKEINFKGQRVWWLQQNPKSVFARINGYTNEYFWKIASFPSSKYRIQYLSNRPIRKLGFLRKINKNKGRRV
jgi:hypothetical protein